MNNTSLGQRIRQARKELSLTQNELAQGIVTSSMICQIENGKAFPSYQVLQSLSERLNKPIEFFVSDTDASKRQRSSYTLAKALMASESYEKAYSLLKTLQETHGTEQDEFQMTLSECCQRLGKFEEASEPLDKLLSNAIHNGDVSQQVTILQRLGDIAEQSGQYQLALYHWHKAYDLLNKSEIDPAVKSRLLTSIGNTYYKLGYLEESLQFLQQAYDSRESFLTLEEVGQMYLNLSLSYRDSNDYKKAAYFSEQAYIIFKSQTNMKLATDVKRSLGVLLGKQGQALEALTILEECMEHYLRDGDLYNLGLTELEAAQILHAKGDLEAAIERLHNSLGKFSHNELETARAHHMLADMYRHKRDLPTAIQHLNNSLHLYQKQGQSVGLIEAMSLSVKLYEEWDNFRQSKYGEAITA
ncbi:helix-turn-helix transcriptional regulator [Tumebacillus sp. ITR2]|uniref:Helix-turn-helix transcriptional regulator n=1 Tax=Tumebacillus amylolyticus TaxID=2801339 RepID=A0ABS1J5E1_9BACL|nr:tetratricopeptide repeat protein [Tumebacillus amylolyticus]MBL0385493.1 helix-turn-helix transcriptional regulator [Tumebacillus amylolyticus]